MERRRRVRRTARLAAVFTAAALFACPAAEAEQAQGAELTGADAGGPEQAAEAAAEPELYALAAVLTDGDTGRILWGKNERERRPMASTTKIMTCILALEEGDPEDIAVFSPLAASQPQVHLGAPAGRSFYLKDLLYSLMLESHNDTAVAVAECVSGSVEEFVAEMNRKAGELGCEDTWFVTPNGLDGTSPDGSGRERAHSTTAADLARIMRYCLRESPAREEFRAITGTSSYTFKDTEGIGTYSCANHNALLTMMEGAVSGKTGFTGEAGYSYVGALERDGKCLIVAAQQDLQVERHPGAHGVRPGKLRVPGGVEGCGHSAGSGGKRHPGEREPGGDRFRGAGGGTGEQRPVRQTFAERGGGG